MLPTLDQFVQFGPVICGLLAFFANWAVRFIAKKEISLTDLLVVGLSASFLPTAFLLMYSAFDYSVIAKLENANVYIAFAGATLIFVFYRAVKEKW